MYERQEEKYALLNDENLPKLAEEGIVFLRRSAWTVEQREWIKDYFCREVMPVPDPYMHLDVYQRQVKAYAAIKKLIPIGALEYARGSISCACVLANMLIAHAAVARIRNMTRRG